MTKNEAFFPTVAYAVYTIYLFFLNRYRFQPICLERFTTYAYLSKPDLDRLLNKALQAPSVEGGCVMPITVPYTDIPWPIFIFSFRNEPKTWFKYLQMRIFFLVMELFSCLSFNVYINFLKQMSIVYSLDINTHNIKS